jgi:hypothetical protein
MMMMVIMMAKIVMMLKVMLMDIKITVMMMITLKISEVDQLYMMPFIAAHEMTRNQTPVDLEFETYSLDRRQR